jgi:hypothetical protein
MFKDLQALARNYFKEGDDHRARDIALARVAEAIYSGSFLR